MEERVKRRLLFIFLAILVAIVLFKYGMTKTYVALNKAAAEKKKTEAANKPAPQQTPEPLNNAGSTPTPASAAVSEAAPADVSAVKNSEEEK